MLRALNETVRDAFTAFDKPKFSEETKKLNKSSTALTSTLVQLAQAVQQL